MKLQRRNLSIRLQGDDVRLLQKELRELGFDIPAGEVTPALFGLQTEDAVERFQTSHRLRATGIVDPQTAKLINREVDRQRAVQRRMFIVSGRIQFANGQPFAAGVVRAFRAALRGEGELAEGRTDAEGAYLIHYAPHAGREDRSFDLRVAAFGADGQELASSPIRFHASADETIDLVVTAQAFVRHQSSSA